MYGSLSIHLLKPSTSVYKYINELETYVQTNDLLYLKNATDSVRH